MRLPLALVALSACADLAPVPYNTEVDPPAELDRAEQIVRVEWSTRLGVDLPHGLPPVTYYLGCLIYPDEYMRQEWYGGCIGGRYFGSGPVVHVKQDGGIGKDALAHELLHWALDVATGNSDGAHADPLWDQVREVDNVLATYALCLTKYDRDTCDGI